MMQEDGTIYISEKPVDQDVERLKKAVADAGEEERADLKSRVNQLIDNGWDLYDDIFYNRLDDK
jgi:hypothetical protein